MLKRAPTEALVVPVRDARVLFALRPKDYLGFAQSQMAQPHEFFCPMDTLIDANPHTHAGLRSLIGRASLAANFMELPSNDAR